MQIREVGPKVKCRSLTEKGFTENITVRTAAHSQAAEQTKVHMLGNSNTRQQHTLLLSRQCSPISHFTTQQGRLQGNPHFMLSPKKFLLHSRPDWGTWQASCPGLGDLHRPSAAVGLIPDVNIPLRFDKGKNRPVWGAHLLRFPSLNAPRCTFQETSTGSRQPVALSFHGRLV